MLRILPYPDPQACPTPDGPSRGPLSRDLHERLNLFKLQGTRPPPAPLSAPSPAIPGMAPPALFLRGWAPRPRGVQGHRLVLKVASVPCALCAPPRRAGSRRPAGCGPFRLEALSRTGAHRGWQRPRPEGRGPQDRAWDAPPAARSRADPHFLHLILAQGCATSPRPRDRTGPAILSGPPFETGGPWNEHPSPPASGTPLPYQGGWGASLSRFLMHRFLCKGHFECPASLPRPPNPGESGVRGGAGSGGGGAKG